jgi:maltose alpha-D-glucosyltransferase / alpha-amylase
MAYRQTLGHAQLWPANPPQADAVLEFFLLEKAFYEIDYELAHRPDWIGVPLAGALRILTQARRE